ncbi:MAG TPA: hypothetical protein ENK57_04335 [Polyangiaceae bacterium]|nr:hypothetical protein [Polyangiaceae bacterium]
MTRSIWMGIVVTAAVGCAGPKPIVVPIAGSPDEALVTVDDTYRGKLGRLEKSGLPLLPGEHRLSIEANGFFPHDQLIELNEDVPPAPITVELQPIPD